MQLRNYMEDLVWQRLDEVLESNPRFCKCEHCRYDVASIALNSLPPKYVVTDQGEAYAKVKSLEQQFTVDVIAAIVKGIQIVSAKPNHDKK